MLLIQNRGHKSALKRQFWGPPTRRHGEGPFFEAPLAPRRATWRRASVFRCRTIKRAVKARRNAAKMVKTRGSHAQSGQRALNLVLRVFYRSVLLTHVEKQRRHLASLGALHRPIPLCTHVEEQLAAAVRLRARQQPGCSRASCYEKAPRRLAPAAGTVRSATSTHPAAPLCSL